MGLAAVPGRQAAFREGLEQAVQYAKALGCPRYWNPQGSGPHAQAWRVRPQVSANCPFVTSLILS